MTRSSHNPDLRTRSAREPAADGDGRRILVDRLWPRGISKEKLGADAWVKDIAPSDGLRKWFGHDPERWDGFRERYFGELDDNPVGLEALRAEMRGARRVTLLFGAHDKQHNNAVALVEYLTL